MTKKKTVVAIYSRVSSDRQREEKTIRSQIAVNNSYAKGHGYRVFERYEDDGISGAASIKERKGLGSLLDAAKEGHFKRVLIWDWNRLGRQDDFELLVQLSQSGIHEIEETSTGTLHDLNTFVGKLMSAVKTLMASEERKELAAKIKRGKDFKRKQGHWLGLPPFGYDYDKQTKKFSFNEKEKELVEWMYEKFLVDGWSVRMIEEDLYRRGERWRKGKPISNQTIRYLFKSETYTGRLYANRSITRGNLKRELRPREEWIEYKVPALISRKTHKKILSRLAKLRRTGRPTVPGRYLFAGMLQCGLCGARLRVHKTQWSCYYSCHNRSEPRERERSTPDKKRCTLPYIRSDKFDRGLFQFIIQQLSDPEVLKREIAKQNFSPGRVEQLEKKKRKLELEDVKIAKKITNLLSVIEDLPKQEAHERIWQRKAERAQIVDDIQEIEHQLETARQGDERMEGIARNVDEIGHNLWSKIFEEMISLGPEYQRRVVEALFDSLSERITVMPPKKKFKKYKKSLPLGGVSASWTPNLSFDLMAVIAERAKLGESLKDAFKYSFGEREASAKQVVKKAKKGKKGKKRIEELHAQSGPCDPPWSTSEREPLLRSLRRSLLLS